ncbi:hypothetical protein [Leptospira sp. GIMC2001]|uniref:hypothetical protein n=1 Tax=Leptospira sp. GIMC2001 TaxID=1513297 RepID=UPI00234A3AC1|nr:hypothetical protein [Leptospira sp. GIMC2001]WCL50994.1 hypothetical protein O4O04_09335 [Leptospira sp. GIMC2001]
MNLNLHRQLCTLILILLSLNCATNLENLRKLNHPVLKIIGTPIYFLSLKEYGKVFYLLLEEDGSVKTDFESLSNCKEWDVLDSFGSTFILCGEEKYSLSTHLVDGWSGRVNSLYDKKIMTDGSLNFKTFQGKPLIDMFTKNAESKGHDLSRVIKKEQVFTDWGFAYVLIGDDSLKKFQEFIASESGQNDLADEKLVRKYSPEKILDLRVKENEKDFSFLYFNVLADPDLQFRATPENENLRLSEFEKKYKDLQPLKSKKFLIFQAKPIFSDYDTKKRAFNLYIQSEYDGGFQRIFSPPIVLKVDVEKYEEILDFDNVECIADYEVITKKEKAYFPRYARILNEENYEQYKINYKAELPYTIEKNITYRQIKLKVLNYRIYSSYSGKSYWKQ